MKSRIILEFISLGESGTHWCNICPHGNDHVLYVCMYYMYVYMYLQSQAQVKMEMGICPEEMRKYIFTSVSAIAQLTQAMDPHQSEETETELLDKAHFISLLEMLLTFDPHARMDPDLCLQHSFITMLHLSSHTDTQRSVIYYYG